MIGAGYFFNRETRETSRTHLIDFGACGCRHEKPFCGVKVKKTSKFEWCFRKVGKNNIKAVDCKRCRAKYEKEQPND